ncbi:MAG: 2C-methyl-D-erythritol 2,4-cyclodiphosphate synthase [Moritella dasanensis]|jgi:2C-methyl-D-erythritol 2,4-cyclodiphosphate synthase
MFMAYHYPNCGHDSTADLYPERVVNAITAISSLVDIKNVFPHSLNSYYQRISTARR